MKTIENITLCLTIGKRPNELRQTLQSLLSKAQFKHIIAINDFGDEETNAVFRELCPQGELISLGYNLGHHKAIDYMYAKITSPYVFHCEDDWEFDSLPNFEKIIEFLKHESKITLVCLRKMNDMVFDAAQQQQIIHRSTPWIDVVEVHSIHEQWYGYSFNPHIASIETYKALAPFAQFKKERHISRAFRAQDRYMVYLKEGSCQHIGFDSIANPKPLTFFGKIKAKIFG